MLKKTLILMLLGVLGLSGVAFAEADTQAVSVEIPKLFTVVAPGDWDPTPGKTEVVATCVESSAMTVSGKANAVWAVDVYADLSSFALDDADFLIIGGDIGSYAAISTSSGAPSVLESAGTDPGAADGAWSITDLQYKFTLAWSDDSAATYTAALTFTISAGS